MKAIFSLKKHSYFKIVGTFIIAIALIAGIVGCEGAPVDEYDLTMAVDPPGIGTATDATGTSPYAEGEVVDISAHPPDPCHQFAGWTAPAGTFGDANNATTTFTMPARDVTITANFEAVPPDHFKFYQVDLETAPYIGKEVELVDQFGTFTVMVGDAVCFGNPVEKLYNDVLTSIADENRHYTLYQLDYGEEVPMLNSWKVTINNQFQDDVELTVEGPVALAVPTQKEDHEAPDCLNHFLVYQITETELPDFSVHLKDQFTEEDVVVYSPTLFANPVQKTLDGVVTEIEDPDEHWVVYSIEGESIERRVQIDNQFGPQTFDLLYPYYLALPSQKIAWEQSLDHFKCYTAFWVDDPPAANPWEVQLEDQFVTLNASVLSPSLFANPVNKNHDGTWTPISNWDNHLTLYYIEYEEDVRVWEVTVNNQFGSGQVLYVAGPISIAVPTGKGTQAQPQGLDHFLIYEVIDYTSSIEEDVFLTDQFLEQWATVYEPKYFAIPAQKIRGDVVTPIKHPSEHLVFYWIDGGVYEDIIPIFNQFNPQPSLYIYQDDYDLLAIPSEKIDWDGPWPY